MTEATSARSRSPGCSWSSRAATSAWTVGGIGTSASPAAKSQPSSVARMLPSSTSIATVSVRNSGLPSAVAARRARSGGGRWRPPRRPATSSSAATAGSDSTTMVSAGAGHPTRRAGRGTPHGRHERRGCATPPRRRGKGPDEVEQRGLRPLEVVPHDQERPRSASASRNPRTPSNTRSARALLPRLRWHHPRHARSTRRRVADEHGLEARPDRLRRVAFGRAGDATTKLAEWPQRRAVAVGRHRPRSIRPPSVATVAPSSAARRDLPIPAGPTRVTRRLPRSETTSARRREPPDSAVAPDERALQPPRTPSRAPLDRDHLPGRAPAPPCP